MNEMLTYVFGNLEANRRELKTITKCLRRENISGILTAVAVGLTAKFAFDAYKSNKNKIENLEEEIELLKGQNTNEMEG